jgi:hypothetical protein
MSRNILTFLVLAAATLAWTGPARADNYSETIKLFQDAGESKTFFGKSYGYAVFPTIGKGGIGIGGAYGKGRVYVGGAAVGETSMAQVSYGFQLGGQGYSMIIFFEDKRAFDEFTKDGFEFGGRIGRRGHGRHYRRGQRRQEGRDHLRRLLQGNGDVHHHQGWRHVRGSHRRRKILLQAAQVGTSARPAGPARHSWRRASIGSSRAARRAGIRPNTSPTVAAKPKDSSTLPTVT